MTIRTVLIGLGWSGQQIWLPRLLARPDYDVVAAVDPDAARRAAFGAATGRPALADVAELDAGSADLAVVAVPNHAHASVARAVLLRGLATFVEKPVCLSAAEADSLADAERRGGAPLLAGSASRYRADVAALRELVPELGRVRNVDLAWTRLRGVPQGRGWFTDRARAGGGVLLDLGWHLLEVLEEVIGPVTVTQVAAMATHDHVDDPDYAAGWRADLEDGGPAGTGVEDTVRAFLVAAGGLSIGLRASWASHSEAHDVSSVRVEGSAGTAALRCTFGFSPYREPEPQLLHSCRGELRRVPVPVEPIGAEYDRQLDDLGRCLADPRTPGRAIAAARRTVGTIQAIYAAAADSLEPDRVPVEAALR